MADLKALGMRFYDDVLVGGDLSLLDELVDEGFVEHEAFPGMSTDKAGLATFVTTMHDAFPDVSIEVLAMATDGDEVWSHAVLRGTHHGEFMGIPATGRAIEVAMIDRVRVRDGRAIDHWGVTDTLTMFEQLGVLREPE
jgi:steroid delta-isomerase-like uncharacterized protein